MYMSEKEFRNKMRKIRLRSESDARKQELYEAKHKNKKKFQTSKVILWVMIALVLEIVAFVEFAMMKWGDFSSMYALIGIPATLVPVIWGYYSKAKSENTVGGITYETAMRSYEDDSCEDAEG